MHDKNGRTLKVGDQVRWIRSDSLLTIQKIDGECLTTDPDNKGVHGEISAREVEKVRTWKELAQEAIDVQNASNLSGVARSFAQVVSEVRIRIEHEGSKTETKEGYNRHPIIQLWSDKIASLTGTQFDWSATKAYDWAYKQVEEKKEDKRG